MEILKTYQKEVNALILANQEEVNEELKPYALTALDLLMQDIALKDDKTYENIKNYYRYYIIVVGLKCLKNKLSTLKDFDCYEGIIKKITQDYPDLTFINYRYFQERKLKICLETDTAYSFKRIFHDFLRKNYNEFFIDYLKFYNLSEPNEIYKSGYLLKNIANLKLKEEHQKLMAKFNKLAYLYHTYNNVILVPYCYNCARADLFLDLFPLSMQNLLDLGFGPNLIQKYSGYEKNDEMVEFFTSIKPKLYPNYLKNIMTTQEYHKYLDYAFLFIERKRF